ncbi:MAG TPA: hypothetical protein EYH00_02540 [Archaeoglobus profundus]|nr:hypothetical protein [Archaeoglobus profundus]
MVERLDELERIRECIKELEAKIVELSKVVDNLISEIMYIKSELKRAENKERSEKSRKLVKAKEMEEVKNDNDIIIID